MRSKVLRVAFCALLLALGNSAQAQQPKSNPRIGFLSRDLHPSDSRAPAPCNLEAFLQGLQKLGYIDGKTIIIEYRYADGRSERLPALAEELIRLNVAIIVADSYGAASAAKKVTTTIPVIMASGVDPTATGLAASLARPGGNVTGLTDMSSELTGKRLELLKEVVPKILRFAFLNAANSATGKSQLKDGQEAARH